jgi:hypothetical protein
MRFRITLLYCQAAWRDLVEKLGKGKRREMSEEQWRAKGLRYDNVQVR